MKYPYRIEYTEYGSPVMILPKGMELVSTFLFSDIQRGNKAYYLPYIDRVLNDEVSSWAMTGNACRLEIKKDVTHIIDYLAVDDDPDNEYVIETPELRELIVIWSDILERPVPPQKQ